MTRDEQELRHDPLFAGGYGPTGPAKLPLAQPFKHQVIDNAWHLGFVRFSPKPIRRPALRTSERETPEMKHSIP